MRKRLFEIIELSDGNDRLSGGYDLFMMCTIVISLFPLAFKETNNLFFAIDYITAGIFVIDYILRFITADYKLGVARTRDSDKNERKFGGGKTIYSISFYAYGYY